MYYRQIRERDSDSVRKEESDLFSHHTSLRSGSDGWSKVTTHFWRHHRYRLSIIPSIGSGVGVIITPTV